MAIDEKKPSENISPDIPFHSVHVGTFKSASLAKEQIEGLINLGYPSLIYTQEDSLGDTVYIAVAGIYQSYDLAKEASRNLSKEGYSNFIARAKDSLGNAPTISKPPPQTNTIEQQSQAIAHGADDAERGGRTDNGRSITNESAGAV